MTHAPTSAAISIREIAPNRPLHEYLPQIDGLRALAVLSVIIFHLGINWIPGGFVGVDIFFVISGFVVANSVSQLSFKNFSGFITFFYARRILRIMPALVLCVLVTLLLAKLFIPNVWLSRANNTTAVAAIFGVSNFALAFNHDTYFSPTSAFNPFTHTWSLGIEEQFYLIFPLLWFFWVYKANDFTARRLVIYSIAMLSFASLIACAVMGQINHAYAFYLIPSRFWELGAGVVLSATISLWRPKLAMLGRDAAIALTAASVALLIASLSWANEGAFPFPWAIPPVLATVLAIAVITARSSELPARLLAASPAVYIGKRSYSLYLWHWPIFVLLRWTIGLESVLSIVVALLLTFGLALSAYHFVEVPLRSSAAIKERPRYQVVFAGLGVMVLAAGLAVAIIRPIGHRIALSVTNDTSVWFPDQALDVGATCSIKDVVAPFGAGSMRTLAPDCPSSGKRLYVMGDSHAGAYFPMFAAFAAKNADTVIAFDFPGCGAFRLSQPQAMGSEACGKFVNAALVSVTETARPGDTLFLPSLRLARTVDQWGFMDSPKTAPDPQLRSQAIDEAIRLLGPLAGRGINIVFEAPKPIFRTPTFRCDDWFNRMNPICKFGFEEQRSVIEQKREPVVSAMQAIAAKVPSVTIWDPLPLLCPSEICNEFAHGKPLFVDADHVTRYGNSVLFPDFNDFVLRLPKRNG